MCWQAGSGIPSVSLFVVNLYGPAHTLEMLPPDSLRARYISVNLEGTWMNSDSPCQKHLLTAETASCHLLFFFFLVFSYTTVSCNSPAPIVSPEKATSPWWPGSAAPGWRCAGSTGPKTNQCSACARPPRGHVRWWAAVTRPVLAIWPASAAVHSFNRVLDHSHGCGSLNWFSEAPKFVLAD